MSKTYTFPKLECDEGTDHHHTCAHRLAMVAQVLYFDEVIGAHLTCQSCGKSVEGKEV